MIKRFKKIITLLSILYCVICAQASCVDKNYENDLNPKLPTNNAENGNFGDQGSEAGTQTGFPLFDDGILSFPGAEGYGKDVTGARGGEGTEIYHVTNLNDTGTGSFRDAVSKPWRIIVFDVSGIIKCGNSPIILQSNQTILGQIAPGKGVVLYGGRVTASGAKNLIVRYLRMRLGAGYSGDKDACGVANGTDMIFDHCSITWGKDENFSINADNKE